MFRSSRLNVPWSSRRIPRVRNHNSQTLAQVLDVSSGTKNGAVERKPKNNTAKGSGDGDVIRVETSLVVSDVLVLDQRGQPVQGLTQKDFVITEDGKLQLLIVRTCAQS